VDKEGKMNTLTNYSQMEYLLTNNLGGTSSSTGISNNTSRYHSILSVSLNPPVDRRILVSRVSEIVENKNEKHYISTLKDANGYKEKGFDKIISFKHISYPEWLIKINNIFINKKIIMLEKKNLVALIYENFSNEPTKLTIIPYLNDRDIHKNTLPNQLNLKITESKKNFNLINTNFNNKICINTNGLILENDHKINNIFYDQENERGLFAYEEIISKNKIEKVLMPNEKLYITFSSLESIYEIDNFDFIDKFIKESEDKQKSEKIDDILKINSKNFISYRKSTKKHTIMAGFPWFTDWGRDTMIALEGLTLSQNKISLFKEIMETFLENESEGLIPNVFDDYTGKPGGYNTADGTLWLFIAMYKYYIKTNDESFIKKYYKKMENIIEKHIKGTKYNIYMDKDYLLYTGNKETQLTWMDVKVDDWVVTPRYGKAVEINALWFNSIKIMEFFSEKFHLEFKNKISNKILDSFNKIFWNEKENCLYDYINENEKNKSIRPNQIFSVSLPFNLLNDEKSKQIVKKVFDELFTPFGLKTLSQKDPSYIGIYTGNRTTRDGSYHQGNVWPWLLGPFYEALLKTNNYSFEIKKLIKELLKPLENMIQNEWCSTIPEILEGNWPHNKKGCFSQAWSVSEIIRIYSIIND
jgi:predicted glycogen debranching enzyme